MPKEKRKLPFDCIVGTEKEEVSNPYSGEKVTLEPDAVAVLDVIKGAEALGNYRVMNKGLIWFRTHFPEEYMVLLD